MWIKCNNEATERLYDDEIMDEPVELNDSGTAQVKREVGVQMTERYDSIVQSGTEEEETVAPTPDDASVEEVVDVSGGSVEEAEEDDSDEDEDEN